MALFQVSLSVKRQQIELEYLTVVSQSIAMLDSVAVGDRAAETENSDLTVVISSFLTCNVSPGSYRVSE